MSSVSVENDYRSIGSVRPAACCYPLPHAIATKAMAAQRGTSPPREIPAPEAQAREVTLHAHLRDEATLPQLAQPNAGPGTFSHDSGEAPFPTPKFGTTAAASDHAKRSMADLQKKERQKNAAASRQHDIWMNAAYQRQIAAAQEVTTPTVHIID